MATATPAPLSEPSSDRAFFTFNAILSLGALAFLTYLLVLRKADPSGVDLSFLPAVNASLNATAAVFLCSGHVAIRRGARKVHQYLMASAFAASTLFLISYLTYHFVHGHVRYSGSGAGRAIYLFVLLSHIALSTTVVPLALTSFYYAWRDKRALHRRISKVTLPVWLYVSVTGVLIYFLLRSPL
jgi:putative membrane protein